MSLVRWNSPFLSISTSTLGCDDDINPSPRFDMDHGSPANETLQPLPPRSPLGCDDKINPSLRFVTTGTNGIDVNFCIVLFNVLNENHVYLFILKMLCSAS